MITYLFREEQSHTTFIVWKARTRVTVAVSKRVREKVREAKEEKAEKTEDSPSNTKVRKER